MAHLPDFWSLRPVFLRKPAQKIAIFHPEVNTSALKLLSVVSSPKDARSLVVAWVAFFEYDWRRQGYHHDLRVSG